MSNRHHTAFPDHHPGRVGFSGPLSQHEQDLVRGNSTKSLRRFVVHHFFLSLVFKDHEQRRDEMGVRHLAKDKSDLMVKEGRADFIRREQGRREHIDRRQRADITQGKACPVSDEQGKRRIEESFSKIRSIGVCVGCA